QRLHLFQICLDTSQLLLQARALGAVFYSLGLGGSTGAGGRGLSWGSQALGLARERARHETGARGVGLLSEVLQDFVGFAYLGRDEQVDNHTACAQPLDFYVLDINFSRG
ncbi:MAG: hypothetical protein ACK55Z_06940, partial [bacterium]